VRFQHPDGTVVHAAYCTNVHPAEDFDGVLGQLARFAEPVRERLDIDRLGLGLWLARDVATTLLDRPGALHRLAGELAARGLEVVTLNGFPYEGFGGPEVKHRVYTPDWSQPARTAYTADLARILAALLPADVARGSISTLPLGWRHPWFADRAAAARQQIGRLGETLTELAEETGRRIRVGFEPEPGCVIETTQQAGTHLTNLDPDLFGVCLDTCHLAVAHEDPAAALVRLAAAGLPVVKVQASVALECARPGDPAGRRALEAFVEPRFLHQTRAAGAAADDLDEALGLVAGHPLPARAPWRIHFHIPLHAPVEPPLRGTHQVLRTALAELFGGPVARTDHIEVETYTWSVLPAQSRPVDEDGLIDSIAAELSWLRAELTALGLKELTA
jgi:sugar phosphate isomerase/epimerase